MIVNRYILEAIKIVEEGIGSKELNKESKWVLPNLLKAMIRANKLGRKTGGGWYDCGK